MKSKKDNKIKELERRVEELEQLIKKRPLPDVIGTDLTGKKLTVPKVIAP